MTAHGIRSGLTGWRGGSGAKGAPLPPLTKELLAAGTNALEDILLNLCDGFTTPETAVEIIYKAMSSSFYANRSCNSYK
jgi:hypothetical protein